MQPVPKNKLYAIVTGVMLFLLAVFLIGWFCIYNRYLALHFHEQMQLFRYDVFYFRSFMVVPGGLTDYFGSFLTQFYVNAVAGAAMIALVVMAVVLLFYAACKQSGTIGQLLFIPFMPAILLMMSFMDIYFDMSAALGLLFFLVAFRCYYIMPLAVRYAVGPLAIAITYFIAGGNALLLLVMILIFELTGTKTLTKENAKRSKIPYLLLLCAWSVLLPLLACHLIYTVSVREAFFAFTPMNVASPSFVYLSLWMSFPVLYLGWKLVANKTNRWTFSSWKMLTANCLLVIFLTGGGAFSMYDRRAELLIRMTYELDDGNYQSVLRLSKENATLNPLICYITNIALAESGQLPYRMFQYKQLGATGLFLDQYLFYSALWYLGEVYYRLGMIPEAEHCAFEALVSTPNEPNVQTLRRLVITNIVRRDAETAEKYLRYLDYSLAYRKWAQQQRTNLEMAMADTSFHVPGTPIPYTNSDFFINYQRPDNTLLVLLQANPNHRMAFEYLMAFYLLEKDIERMKWCMDQYFKNFDYPVIPVHYEEALIAYKNLTRTGDEFFEQYPVSQATRDRFKLYLEMLKVTRSTNRNFAQFEKQFSNTYWYYLNFVEHTTIQKKDEENRY